MNAEQAKMIADFFADLMEGEAKTTAKVLAAVPEDKKDYRPDAKSRSAWELALHIATGHVFLVDGIVKGKFHYDAEAMKQMTARLKTIDDVVKYFERECPTRLQALRSIPADKLVQTLDFMGVFKQPAAGHLGWVNNHHVHHRGQLASYLRAMGSKVPQIYGPSADEPMTR
jgi:uncharacterized damage-inducible protein DinB